MVGVVAQVQAQERAVRVAVALASRARVEEDQALAMAHGQTALTQDGQHQALVLASQARVEVDQDLARVVRAAEEVDPAMTVHGEPMMENGRPQDLARVNLGRAEEDQARVNQERAEVVDLRMKMMVGPLVTNGRPRLALVRVGRAEVDQASRARAQLVVGEIVLARLNQS